MILLIVSVFFIALLLILIIAPIRTKVIYQRKGEDDYAGLELFLLWSLLPVRIELTSLQGPRNIFRPLLKIKSKITSKGKKPVSRKEKSLSVSTIYQKLMRNLHYFKLFNPAFKYVIKKLKVLNLRWETTLGFENAALTGMTTGALWTLKGLLAGTLYQITGYHKSTPQLTINPIYNKEVFNTEFHCIFEIRPGHIIISILKMVKLWLHNRINPGSEKYARTAPN